MDADGRRKEARDRRDAAVHEAGHVVVARHVGVTVVSAYIYPVPDALDDYLNRTMWNGDTVLARFDNASPEQLAKIAVAGAIATLSWRGKPIELWKFQMKSFSDWAMCGCQPGRATIEMVTQPLPFMRFLTLETECFGKPFAKAHDDSSKTAGRPRPPRSRNFPIPAFAHAGTRRETENATSVYRTRASIGPFIGSP
jgi:hypothetical protein